MADAEERDDGLYVTVDMQGVERIDLDVGGLITFEEFAASMRRAGVNRFICHLSHAKRGKNGQMNEVLDLQAVYVDEAPTDSTPTT